MAKLLTALALAVACASPAAHAAGEMSAEQYREALAGHRSAWRLSDLLELGAEAVARYPDHAELRYLYGLGLRRSLHTDEAIAQLERAHALAPDNADIAMALARTHASRGDLDQAESVARAAAAHDAAAAVLARTLAAEQRVRAGTSKDLEPGSASAFAHRFLSELSRDRLEDALARYGAPEAFDRIIHAISGQTGPVKSHDRRKFIAQTATILTAAWENELGAPGTTYLGYEVQGQDTLPSGAVVANGVMIVSKEYSSVSRDELRRALEAEQADIDADAHLAYRGLESEARDEFVARLATTRRSIHVPFSVYLRQSERQTHEGSWAIFDISFGEPPMYVSELARHSWDLAESRATTAASNRRDLLLSILLNTAEVALLVVILAVIIFFVRRKLRG